LADASQSARCIGRAIGDIVRHRRIDFLSLL